MKHYTEQAFHRYTTILEITVKLFHNLTFITYIAYTNL